MKNPEVIFKSILSSELPSWNPEFIFNLEFIHCIRVGLIDTRLAKAPGINVMDVMLRKILAVLAKLWSILNFGTVV
jgi:hypothetical protein